MGILSLLNASDRSPAARRRHTFTPDLGLGVEKLESRVVLSPKTLGAVVAAPAPQAHATQALTITDINVTDLRLDGNRLTATADVSGNLFGRAFDLTDFQIPIDLSKATINNTGPCPILSLSLEIEDLNLLGLHVELNNCNEGPIQVDITAIPTGMVGGGVLGDLLCSLTDGLPALPNIPLADVLGGLNPTQLGQLEGALTGVINGVLGDVLGGGGGAGAQHQHSGGGRRCDILNLELAPINLNVLGLQVKTSAICLEVYAVKGDGLLGNLLCGLTNPNGNRFGLLKQLDRFLAGLNA